MAAVAGGLVLAVTIVGARSDMALMIAGALLAAACLALWRRDAANAAAAGLDAAPTAGADREALFEALAEALPSPLLVAQGIEPDDVLNRRYSFANQAARQMLRLDAENGVLVQAIRDPDVLEAADEALFGGIGAECLYEIAGVQPRTLRVQARPLPAGPDGARQALLVFHDESDLRQSERTRADFLANASHELRTPLASLLGFIETLRGHAREDEVARERFLAIMQGQAERMSRLIDDLLSLSRIELNEHVAPAEAADLAVAVRDAIDAAALTAKARDVRLETNFDAAQALVTGDRDQLVQVAQNLIDNAVKYSPPRGVVRIGLRPAVSLPEAAGAEQPGAARLSLLTPDRLEGRFLALTIRDHGAGMAREHLPRLTERFYRVEGQKSGERSGTGLGLAIVKHIVNRHRGGLMVESAEGEGTTFTVYLPVGT